MKFEVIGVFCFVMVLGFVSAGFDLNGSCEDVVLIFENADGDFVVPDGVLFWDDVLNVYLDDEFFVRIELEKKKLSDVSCEDLEDGDYGVYVASSLVGELKDFNGDYMDFYEAKTKSGELRVEGVGFGNSLKLGFVKFGIWVASWFS